MHRKSKFLYTSLLTCIAIALFVCISNAGPTSANQLKDPTVGTLWANATSSGLAFPQAVPGTMLWVNSSGFLQPVTIGANIAFNTTTGTISATGGGTGTVTSFSAGNLSPLFTSSVATSTTTPALTFGLSNAAINTVLAGPASGATGAPNYRSLVLNDLPTGYLYSNLSGAPTTYAWSSITGTPTTLSGYGITDPIVLTSSTYANPSWITSYAYSKLTGAPTSYAWSTITGTPTTLSGYGITDPVVVTSGSYSNPAWITALAYSKLTGAPTLGPLSSITPGGTPSGSPQTFLAYDGTNYNWLTPPSGTVTSVGLSLPLIFTTTGSPITTSGTITASLAAQQPNYLWAGPATGTSAGLPTFRPFNVNDFPQIASYTYLGNGTNATAAPSANTVLTLGAPGFTDTAGTVAGQLTGGLNNYYQFSLQNTNGGSAASTDYVVGNNLETSTTHYADFGMNSSTFSGTGSLALPNAAYLYSQNGDMVVGTDTANTLRFVYNNGATDSFDIGSSGLVVPAFTTTGLITNNTSGVLSSTTESAWLDSNFSNAQGSLLYRGSGGWAALAPGTTGYVLSTQGSSANPQWIANSAGFTNPMTTLGDTIYGGTSGTGTRLAGYTTANQAVLAQTGTGSASAAPVWTNAPSLSAVNMSQGSSSAFGVLKVDGTTLTTTSGVASATTATTSQLGVVKPDGTVITDVAGAITVPAATSSAKGVVQVDGSTITSTSGTIKAATATSAALGVVQPDNSTVTINGSGVISVPTGSSSAKGVLQVDGTTITATSGVISAVGGSGGGNNFKNRIIDGDMRISQRYGTASTNMTSTNAYFLDHWYGSCSGTGTTGTIAQTTNPGSGFQYGMQVTGNANNTGVILGQKIEATNIYDLAGSTTCTISCYAASSSLSSLTMTIYTATGGVDTWTSRSAVAVKTWTINGTLTQYSYTFTFSSDTNGVSVEFTTGTLTASNTLTITGVQLESGSTATTFERTPYTPELLQCQRYFYQIGGPVNSLLVYGGYGASTNFGMTVIFPAPMRIAPTMAVTGGSISYTNASGIGALNGVNSSGLYATSTASGQSQFTNPAGVYVTFSAEL